MEDSVDPTAGDAAIPRQFRELEPFTQGMLDICKKVAAPRLYGERLRADLSQAIELAEKSKNALAAGLLPATKPVVFAYVHDLKACYFNEPISATRYAAFVLEDVMSLAPPTAAVATATRRWRATQARPPSERELIAAVKDVQDELEWAVEFSLSLPALQERFSRRGAIDERSMSNPDQNKS